GESPENQARYNLRYALWNIRKLLDENETGEDPLIATRSTCQVNPAYPYTTDVQLFLQDIKASEINIRDDLLISALDRYRGSFLDGFIIRDLPDWEDWLFQRREELHNKYVKAALKVGTTYLQSENPDAAVTTFIRILGFSPELEPAHEGLIRAYADQGKTNAALRHYNHYLELTKREFNAPPRAKLTELAESLRRGDYVKTPKTNVDDSRQRSAVSYQPSPSTSPSTSALEVPPAVFIGRERELQHLDQLLEEIKSGSGHVLIISGEMGIGKTALFQQFQRRIPESFFTGVGEAQQIGSSRPLEEVMQVLEVIGKDARLPVEMREELRSLEAEQVKVLESSDAAGGELLLLDAVRRWIVRLAGIAPVMITMDDLHWAGQATLNFFSTLAHDVKRLPILLVGIFRTFELQSEDEIASSLVSIARTGRLLRIELGSLNPDETKLLITSQASHAIDLLKDQDLDKLYRYTNGIPLYAIELAHFLEEGRAEILDSPILEDKPDFHLKGDDRLVPPLMIRITNLRLSKLSKPRVELLKLASLLLGKFSLELAMALTKMESDEIEDILVDLEHRNFIHHSEAGALLIFEFNHQMVKLAIIETIPLLERRRLYARVAKTVEETNEEVSPEAMAYYLYNAGQQREAIPFLTKSAQIWMGLSDRQRAVHYSRIAFNLALENIAAEPEVMLQVVMTHADLLTKAGLLKPAMDAYNDVIAKFENSGAQEHGDLVLQRDKLRELLKQEPPRRKVEAPPLALVTTKRALANVKLLQKDYGGARTLLEEAERQLDLMPNTPDTIREAGMNFLTRAKLLFSENQIAAAQILIDNAVELLKVHGTPGEVGESYRVSAKTLAQSNQRIRAREVLEQGLAYLKEHEDKAETLRCYHDLGMLTYSEGKLDEAEDFLVRAYRMGLDNLDLTLEMPRLKLDLARVLLAQKDQESARILLNNLESVFLELSDTQASQEVSDLLRQL
ncbi:MAG: AAA family ATPase, partial [Calditrichota bacterium]